MKVWVHFVFSLLISGILFQWFGWKVIFVLAGGVLIDIDHYLWYVYKYKKLSVYGAYKSYLDGLERMDFMANIGILLIFHTIEFLIVMVGLSFYSTIFLLFTIGLLSHYILDFIFLYFIAKKVIANHSIILWVKINLISTKFK